MKFTFVMIVCIGCAANWDVPKTPHRNHITGELESKYVYFPAQHVDPHAKQSPAMRR